MLQAKVTVTGLPLVIKKLQRLRKIGSTTDVYTKIGDLVIKDIRSRFLQKNTPQGRPWKPVARFGQITSTPLRRSRGPNSLYNSFRLISWNTGARIFTDNRAAGPQNYRYAMRPNQGHRYLAIPLRKEAYGRSPRTFKNLFVKKIGSSKFIVKKVKGGGQPFEFWYLLKPRVQHPGREFFGVSTKGVESIQKFLGAKIQLGWETV